MDNFSDLTFIFERHCGKYQGPGPAARTFPIRPPAGCGYLLLCPCIQQNISDRVRDTPHPLPEFIVPQPQHPFQPIHICECLTDYITCHMIGWFDVPTFHFFYLFSSLCLFKACVTICFLMTRTKATSRNALIKYNEVAPGSSTLLQKTRTWSLTSEGSLTLLFRLHFTVKSVQTVQQHKCSGTITVNKLTLDPHVNAVCAKPHQRMYFGSSIILLFSHFLSMLVWFS